MTSCLSTTANNQTFRIVYHTNIQREADLISRLSTRWDISSSFLLLSNNCLKQLSVITARVTPCVSLWRKMSNLGNPVADDRVELVDDEQVGIKYRLRKCGKCRLIVISLVILCVIGAAVALAVILTRGMCNNLVYVWSQLHCNVYIVNVVAKHANVVESVRCTLQPQKPSLFQTRDHCVKSLLGFGGLNVW